VKIAALPRFGLVSDSAEVERPRFNYETMTSEPDYDDDTHVSDAIMKLLLAALPTEVRASAQERPR
jgi:hypothetical protein